MIQPNPGFIERANQLRFRLEILGKIHGSEPWRYAEIPKDGTRLLMCPSCDIVCQIGTDIPFEAISIGGVFPFDDVEKAGKCRKDKDDGQKKY